MTIEQVFESIKGERVYIDGIHKSVISDEKAFKRALYDALTIWRAEYLKQIAVLDAKVFAYEEIIKKSNFRPFVEKPTYEETSKNENPSPEEMDATQRYYNSLGR